MLDRMRRAELGQSEYTRQIRDELIGSKSGFLTVHEWETGKHGGQTRAKYRCTCVCGNTHYVFESILRSGKTSSCGCKTQELRFAKLGVGWREDRERNKKFLGNKRWQQIQHSAKKRGHEISITREQAQALYDKQGGKCALSGLDIFFPETTKERWTASLDRKDNDKGYVDDNVQWLHADVNIMKQAMKQSEFIDLCCAIASNAVQNEGSLRGLS